MTISELRANFDQIVIFDTEFTTWEGAMERRWSGENEHRELVQLAAAKVNVQTEAIIDTFTVFVQPRINPQLSDYFVNLTGITQEKLADDGVDFVAAYTNFMKWADGLPCFSYGHLDSQLADATVFVENIGLYTLDVSVPAEQFFNIRQTFQAAGVPTEQYNSGKLYQHFSLELNGREHDAMHDVESLAFSLFTLP